MRRLNRCRRRQWRPVHTSLRCEDVITILISVTPPIVSFFATRRPPKATRPAPPSQPEVWCSPTTITPWQQCSPAVAADALDLPRRLGCRVTAIHTSPQSAITAFAIRRSGSVAYRRPTPLILTCANTVRLSGWTSIAASAGTPYPATTLLPTETGGPWFLKELARDTVLDSARRVRKPWRNPVPPSARFS